MSQRFPGGFITKTPTAPTSSSAPGIWTLDQAMQNQKAGNWPSGFPNYIEDVFSTWLYTGTAATQTITNGIDLSTNGGMVWMKNRTTAYDNAIVDSARGLTNGNIVVTNLANAAQTSYPANGAGISSFNTNGFTLRADTGGFGTNYASSENIVSWTFRKQAKFFDIVTYTGNGSAPRNIAHNLGSVPGCIMIKRTDTTGTWTVYHAGIGNTKALFLNADSATDTNSAYWNNTTPTSSVFTLGGTFSDINASGGTYVAYLFADNAGGFGLTGSDNVISCGSFVTGSTGVETITLGYEPQWVMFKRADSTGGWIMLDTMRGFPNGSVDAYLQANTSAAETTAGYGHPTATGFVINAGFGSGQTYIYIAIRRGPMKVPTVGTSVFSPNVSSATTGTAVTTSFPIDLQIQDYRVTPNSNFVDKLRGFSSNSTESGNYLRSVNTNAEASGSVSLNWNNTSFQITSAFSGADTVYYSFRRAPSFFDEVCYTGTGAGTTTKSHNLGSVPELMIVKCRDTAYNWAVYSSALGNTKYLQLSNTTAVQTDAGIWNSTTPTSTVFSTGLNSDTNGGGATYVAYLFATCAGVSKVGSYTGTAALLTVNCGFTSGARFVLIKRTDSTGDWYVYDSARGISSGTDPYLLINSTAAEVTGTNYVDTDTTGFKVTAAAPAGLNASGGTYIFLAIA